jgi:hypothetical protein
MTSLATTATMISNIFRGREGAQPMTTEQTTQVADSYRAQGIAGQLRTRAEVERFFDGLDLVVPGLVLAHRWRPGETAADLTDAQVSVYGAVARKS